MSENGDFMPSLDDLIIMEDGMENDQLATIEDPTKVVEEQEVDPIEEEIDSEEEIQESTETEEDPKVTVGNEQIQGYYKFLKEAGMIVLPDEYAFDGTEEGFLKAVEDNNEAKESKIIQEVWNALTPDFQVMLEYALNGGSDINEIYNTIKATPLNIDSYDLENEEHQRSIVKEYLTKTTKYNETKINSYIKAFEDSDILEQEAQSALGELKELNKLERQQVVAQQAQKAALEQEKLVESFNTFKEVTSKMSIPDKRKDQIIEAVWGSGKYGDTNQSYFNYINNQIYNNPDHYAQLVNLYLDYDKDKGFKHNKQTGQNLKNEAAVNLRNTLADLLSGGTPTGGKASTVTGGSFDFEKFNKLS